MTIALVMLGTAISKENGLLLYCFLIHSSKDCKKDLKVKAKAPMVEFLRTVKTTLAELDRIPGMSLFMLLSFELISLTKLVLCRERESSLSAFAYAR